MPGGHGAAGQALEADQPTRLLLPAPCRPVRAAREGVAWTPEEHRRWPASFKVAARLLLLLARRGGGGTHGGAGLGDLPPDLMLQVVRLAATPVHRWL